MAGESDYGVCSDANEMSLPPCKSRSRTFVVNRSTGANFTLFNDFVYHVTGEKCPHIPVQRGKIVEENPATKSSQH